MDTFNIVMTILWMVLLSSIIIDLIFPHILKGNLILKVQNEKLNRRVGNSIYWVVFAMIWFFMLEPSRYIIFLIICSILQIIMINRPIVIREKGIYFNLKFYKFKKMISYTFPDEKLLKINYMNIFREKDSCNLEIKDNEMALKVDEVLRRYVKQEESF